jgi:hypothetical protein
LPPGATRRAHLLTGATGMRNFLNSLPEKIGKLLKD